LVVEALNGCDKLTDQSALIPFETSTPEPHIDSQRFNRPDLQNAAVAHVCR
jgi:hypothetical protein